MNRYILNILFFTSCFSFLHAMEPKKFECRLATSDDLGSLVRLMDEEACQEEGIVIPPKKFRAAYLTSAIDKQQLFVVSIGGTIVGYKKLYLLKDKQERDALLSQEIRCSGAQAHLLYRGAIVYDADHSTQFAQSEEQIPYSDEDTYIYNGGDFTKKELRGQGLNKALMCAALSTVHREVKDYAMQHQSKRINIVYGITGSNGAFSVGCTEDRTRPIARAFIPFAQQMAACSDGKSLPIATVLHERYRAFKPSFAPNSQKFTPLPDSFSVAGAGVILSFSLAQKECK